MFTINPRFPLRIFFPTLKPAKPADVLHTNTVLDIPSLVYARTPLVHLITEVNASLMTGMAHQMPTCGTFPALENGQNTHLAAPLAPWHHHPAVQ